MNRKLQITLWLGNSERPMVLTFPETVTGKSDVVEDENRFT